MGLYLSFLATRTNTPHSQAVMCGSKPEVACHLILKILDLLREKLDDKAAFGTDHVIVMFVIVMVLVISPVIPEADLARESCLGQKFERSIDRGQSDARISFVYKGMQIFAGKVFLSAEKDLEDQVTLARPPQTGFPNVILKDRFLRLKCRLFSTQLRSILPFQSGLRHGHLCSHAIDPLRIDPFSGGQLEAALSEQ